MKILVFGSINIDNIYNVDHIVKDGETISSTSFSITPGGKGANQCIAFARALSLSNVDVYFAGKCSSDASFIVSKLQEANVKTIILDSDVGSGKAIIQVDKNGQNAIIVFGGGNTSITQEEINSVLSNFSQGDVLSINCEINNLCYLVNKAKEKGMSIICNPSPINDEFYSLDLSKIDSFIVNETEACALLNKNLICSVVKTMGKEGAVFYSNYNDFISNKNGIFCPAKKVKVVDTTGAGDAFMGTFYANFLISKNAKRSLEKATEVAAKVVAQKGALN